MSLAVVMSRSLVGLQAPPVRVEVQLSNGLPSFTLVGLADTEVKEARERVRAALAESGFDFPHNKRVTVNLAPADLPKDSGRFDLPMAIGILAAAGHLDVRSLEGVELAGELSLNGELRAVRGAVALALAMRQPASPGSGRGAAPAASRSRCLVLPLDSARLAARVPDVDVRGARHLTEVVQALQRAGCSTARPATPDDATVRMAGPGAPHEATEAAPADPLPGLARITRTSPATASPAPKPGAPDLRDVRGQHGARRALEIAAAGGHGLLMMGPPGSGKSMLAQRLVGLLPAADEEDSLAAAALRGLLQTAEAGATTGEPQADGHRPFRAPHHSASAVALVGGGSPPRPGEISLAHGGVLFLDELPEFARSALEALREPLESGHITISRAGLQASFPARFQLVAAMNPCPCGWWGSASAIKPCRCPTATVERYQARLSGPLLDRIDLIVQVPAQSSRELLNSPAGESTANVAARVAQARAVQLSRQGVINAQLQGAELLAGDAVETPARELLQAAADRLQWSGRAVHRVLKVARTVADLQASGPIRVAHMAEAIQYRRGLAL